MKNNFLDIIKTACKSNNFTQLEMIFQLYDQLQYSNNIAQMAEDLYDWLHRNFELDNMTFALFDMEKNSRTDILKKGDSFYLDDNFSFFFVINTHTPSNAVVSFCAKDQEHYDIINYEYSFLEASFFHISPIIQNGILKKQHVDSSSIDSVTKVFNRKYLITHLTKMLHISNEPIDSIAFLMIGVDRLKAVVDEFDYDIADKVLVELAKTIHSNIDEFDMVGRLTGDEFLVSLISKPEKAFEISQNIVNSFKDIEVLVNKETNQTLKKTICIGIYNYKDMSLNIDDAIKNADVALYEAKNLGRNQVLVYEEDLQSPFEFF